MSMLCHQQRAGTRGRLLPPRRAKRDNACAPEACRPRCYSSADSRPVTAGPLERLPRNVSHAFVACLLAPPSRPVPVDPAGHWPGHFGRGVCRRSAGSVVPAAGGQTTGQPAAALPRSSAARGQYRQQVRLYPPVRRPRSVAEAVRRQGVCGARLPVQRFQGAGTW
ncbi:hypothetical protein D3C81_1602900 [compost metagenome]